MALPYNPLTQEHCDICNNVLATIHEPIAVAQACVDCGFPSQDELAILQRQQQQYAKIKATFFPDQP